MPKKAPPKRGRGRPKGPPTEAITVRLPTDLVARVKASAESSGESLTGFVGRALEKACQTRPRG